ncbi:MAG: RNA polymerase sporulation sigma factor SigK [Clostridia bacterium]|nr:RNA polymerase sporulation sigma factor SigK [Clostridia bacterium]
MFWHFLAAIFSHFSCMILGIENGQNFPPPLNAQEEKKLFLQKKQGDAKARNLLIEHNLRLVAHMVKKYYASYPMQDDLISIGSLGLIKAVDTFDCNNGARFATYAAKCIQNEILMFFRSQKKLAAEVSINETIDVDRDGNPLTYGDIVYTEDTALEELDIQMHIEKALRCVKDVLDERERQIIVLRYGLGKLPPKTQREVASMLQISRSYVSRIEKKALARMRFYFKDSIPNFEK